MDFLAITLFIILFYIRPQEWISFLNTLRPIDAVTAFALVAIWLNKKTDMFKQAIVTPHDWLVYAYYFWIVYTSDSPSETFRAVLPFFMFYYVLVQSLTTFKRLNAYIMVWTGMILFVVLMALGAVSGIEMLDPTDSSYYIEYGFEGRLILNTSIFFNPNALGHSIFPSILLIYFLGIWRRPIFIKEVALFLMAVPAYALYLTQSRGAILAFVASGLIGFIFGRPRVIQIAVIVLAITLGTGAIMTLPRMDTLRNARADEGILWRIYASELGLETALTDRDGFGYDNFREKMQEVYGRQLASHGGYTQVGGELGWMGLLLFLGILYSCAKTLIIAKAQTDQQERIRRCLFVFLVSFAASNWMVDHAFRASFFVMIACVASYHRLMSSTETADEEERAKILREAEEHKGAERLKELRRRGIDPAEMPAKPDERETVIDAEAYDPDTKETSAPESEEINPQKPLKPAVVWPRLGLVDFVLMWVALKVTLEFWSQMLSRL